MRSAAFAVPYLTLRSLILRGHPLSMYAKVSEKLTFLTPWFTRVRVLLKLTMLSQDFSIRSYFPKNPGRQVNNGNTRTKSEIIIDVVLVSLLLILNIFHALFWCFQCLVWTIKCRLGCCLCRCWETIDNLEISNRKTIHITYLLHQTDECH